MSGHSKWKNTRRRKVIQDIKRSKIFSKIIRDVKTAAKLGGKDIHYNSRLRMVLEKALSNNMAKNTFNRAISRYLNNDTTKKNMDDIVYEGYGPGGTALLLKCLTDNKNRVVSELRYVLSKFGGNLGTDGSVAYLFRQQGVISCTFDFPEDIIIDAALKVGADDISICDKNGVIKIYVSLKLLSKMELELKSFNSIIYKSKIFVTPYVYVNLNFDNSLRLSSLVNALKDVEGIYAIYHNGNFLKN